MEDLGPSSHGYMMRLNLEFQDMTGPVAFDDLEDFILRYNALDRSARIVAGSR